MTALQPARCLAPTATSIFLSLTRYAWLQRVALEVGLAEGSGAAAERMYRSITDPAYVKASNKHGKRINPRRGSIPTHLMAAYALGRLPNHEGNLREISKQIEVSLPLWTCMP